MAEKLGEGYVEIEARLDKLEADLKIAEKKTKKATGKMAKGFGSIKTAIMGGVAALGLYAAAAAAVKFDTMARGALDAADKIDKLSSKLGVSTDFLQQAEFAASQSGVGFDTMSMAMQRWTRRAAEAAAGTGEARDAVKELGIDLKDAGGNLKSSEQLFRDALKALSGVENQADKIRLAMKLFDSEGVALVNMADNFESLADEAEKLGIVLDRDTIAKAVTTKDELDKLDRVVKKFTTETLVELAPILVSVAEKMADVAKAAGTWFKNMQEIKQVELTAEVTRLTEEMDTLKDKIAATRATSREFQDLEWWETFWLFPADAIKKAGNTVDKIEFPAMLKKLQDLDDALVSAKQKLQELEGDAGGTITAPVVSSGLNAPTQQERDEFLKANEFVNGLRRDAMKEADRDARTSAKSRADDHKQALKAIEEEQDAQTEQWENFTDSTTDAFANMLADGEVSFKKLGDIFVRNFTQRVISDLVLSKLMSFVGSGLSTIGGGGDTSGGGGGELPSSGVAALPGRRLSAPGPGQNLTSPVVNVYTPPGSETQQNTAPDGSIDLFITSAVARNIGNGGEIAAMMESRYGTAMRPRGR